MAGTYSGGYHGTGDFEFTATTGADIARNHAILRANAERNRARANAGSDRVVQKKDVVKKTKPKKRKPAAGSGPGNVVVGDAPTTGPGLGIVTPNLRDETGVLVPVGAGPGNAVVGGALSGGAGNVVVIGGFEGPELTPGLKNEDNDVVTSGRLGFGWVQPSPLVSDMAVFEDRYGDDGPASWLIPPVIGAADAINTYNANPQVHPDLWAQEFGRRASDAYWGGVQWAYDNDDSAPVPGSWDYQRRKARNPKWGYYDDK